MIYHWSRLATGLIKTCISTERYPCPSVLLEQLSTHLNKIKVFSGLLRGQRIKHSTVKQDFLVLFLASTMRKYVDPGKSFHLLRCLSSPTGKISTTMYKHSGEMTFKSISSLEKKQPLQWIKRVSAHCQQLTLTTRFSLPSWSLTYSELIRGEKKKIFLLAPCHLMVAK